MAADQEGFVQRLLIDPCGVLCAVDLDLSDVTLSAHVESGRHLHFVVPAEIAGSSAVTVGGVDLLGALRSPLHLSLAADGLDATSSTTWTDSHATSTTEEARWGTSEA